MSKRRSSVLPSLARITRLCWLAGPRVKGERCRSLEMPAKKKGKDRISSAKTSAAGKKKTHVKRENEIDVSNGDRRVIIVRERQRKRIWRNRDNRERRRDRLMAE